MSNIGIMSDSDVDPVESPTWAVATRGRRGGGPGRSAATSLSHPRSSGIGAWGREDAAAPDFCLGTLSQDHHQESGVQAGKLLLPEPKQC